MAEEGMAQSHQSEDSGEDEKQSFFIAAKQEDWNVIIGRIMPQSTAETYHIKLLSEVKKDTFKETTHHVSIKKKDIVEKYCSPATLRGGNVPKLLITRFRTLVKSCYK